MHRAIAPDFLAIVSLEGPVERLATGFGFTEGPVWHPVEKHLTFSDIPQSHMRRLTLDGRVSTFRHPSNMANGNAYDLNGDLVTCEHATSSLVRHSADGTRSVLASHYEGRELNSPNDLVVRSNGDVYFTDPTYGRAEYYGVPRPVPQDARGVYRLGGSPGSLSRVADDFEQPNGLCFSLDERRLFVNDTERRHIREFMVQPDGSLSGGAVWAVVEGEGAGAPDGMKMDVQGNLYCTGPGGIHVFNPTGSLLGVISIPENAANFTWGDERGLSLLVTASTSVYRIMVKIAGMALPWRRRPA
jgi:gluconolactonase